MDWGTENCCKCLKHCNIIKYFYNAKSTIHCLKARETHTFFVAYDAFGCTLSKNITDNKTQQKAMLNLKKWNTTIVYRTVQYDNID